MIELATIIFYILLFIIGTFFGSFMTLAVYRIPLKQDILYTHSYCPNCKNKLKILDLIPFFSYLLLGGKCRFCKEKIRIRYFIYEICTGLLFVLLGASLNINILNIQIYKLIYYIFAVLYIVGIFLIAGIDKESHDINIGVLIYSICIAFLYILYLFLVHELFISLYIAYLIAIIILMALNIYCIKKVKKYNYLISILILCLIMIIITGEATFIYTIDLTLIIYSLISIYNIIRKKENKQPSFAFYMVVSNIIAWIGLLFLV